MKVSLRGLGARGPAERGRPRTRIEDVSLEVEESEVLAILGTARDGTALLLDVVAGLVPPRTGTRRVLDEAVDAHAKIARVSLDAPLPEALRVDEVCLLESDLRGESRRFADERLAVLGANALARRTVRSLSREERRTVTFALALSSAKVELLLVEEPFAHLEAVAPARVVEAIRGWKGAAILTTASVREASLVASRFGVLEAGTYRTRLAPAEDIVSMRVVVRERAAALIAALGEEVARVESAVLGNGASAILVSGNHDLARVVTRAIASTRSEVELIEPVARRVEARHTEVLAR